MRRKATTTKGKLFLHAPNVHCGGGWQLLNSLITIKPNPFAWIQLDRRIKNRIDPSNSIVFVENNFFSRLKAEYRLYKKVAYGDTLICFHGLPPLFPTKEKSIVFLQNKLIFDKAFTKNQPLKIKLRLHVERIWLYLLRRRIDKAIVQTPTMKKIADNFFSGKINVECCKFFPVLNYLFSSHNKIYDFIYPANAHNHKNHTTLLNAFTLLAEENIKPSLLLTLEPNTPQAKLAEKLKRKHQLNITNIGVQPNRKICSLYSKTKALIYPSYCESFGLPLLEADHANLAIIAAEVDYVRDLITPTETFDPHSPLSIARAIKRYLKLNTQPKPLLTPSSFIKCCQRLDSPAI